MCLRKFVYRCACVIIVSYIRCFSKVILYFGQLIRSSEWKELDQPLCTAQSSTIVDARRYTSTHSSGAATQAVINKMHKLLILLWRFVFYTHKLSTTRWFVSSQTEGVNVKHLFVPVHSMNKQPKASSQRAVSSLRGGHLGDFGGCFTSYRSLCTISLYMDIWQYMAIWL